MDNSGEMLQLCRLCLVKDDVNIPIFEEQGFREDKLPKKICDGCSYKLDMLYEFWNTTANAEKQLLSWLGEAGMNSKMTDDTMSAVAQQIKPVETFVKQEKIDPSDIHTEENDDDKSYMSFQQKFNIEEAGPSATVTSNTSTEPNEEEPPPKRARRTAAVKAQIAMDPESDDDEDSGEPMTKVEDESEDSDGDDHEPAFVDVPSTSADDQPGPSGVGKDGVEAPTHDSKNEYICHVCNKNCKSLEGMREHLSYVREQFNCESCHTTYLNYEMCPFSVKKCSFCKEFVHSEITHFKCTICFKNFLSGDELRKHSFNPYEAYYCKFCFEYFDGDHTCPGKYKRCAFCKKSCLKMKTYPGAHPCFHTHTKNDLEMLRNAEFTECDVCGETFPKFNFKSHRRTHTHTFKCEICDAAYKTEKFFCQHVRCTHSDEPLNCTACGKILNNYNDYMIHKKKEHPKNKRSICYICGKEIATIYMSSHFQAVHCKELKHKCEHCGKAFTTMQRLTRHRLVHSNEFKHKCPMCGKGFKLPFSLKVHKRSHDEVKPFQCIVCLKTFTTKQWRNNHQKTHKSDIK